MEFCSPVYELLYKCEQMGMKPPKNWDLMYEVDILQACQKFLQRGDIRGSG
jgi:hypothetical protein